MIGTKVRIGQVGGGAGIRTPVPKQSDRSRYMLSLSFELSPDKLRQTGFLQDAALFDLAQHLKAKMLNQPVTSLT